MHQFVAPTLPSSSVAIGCLCICQHLNCGTDLAWCKCFIFGVDFREESCEALNEGGSTIQGFRVKPKGEHGSKEVEGLTK
ncbi:hypothetical protein BD310DRAFT_941383 [Dichomitus squalens]|uniref:Uncharacterized protein n=1 Tax=Dichomitus squalens TaxID=114155 RepID=A0A4Q9PB02_9APHY|nr:hypothetical protein BD310DRAFT_941383 [Dichomitus squalens]